jgi:hypothetical protein
MNAEPLLDFLRRAEEIRLARFPDLFFRGRRSGIPLLLSSLEGPAHWVRLCSGAGSPMELEHVAVSDPSTPGAGPLPLDTLSWSSLAAGFEAQASAGAVFNPDSDGPTIATRPGKAEWISFRLPRSLSRMDLLVRARDDRWSSRAWGLAVEVSSDGQSWRRVYSHLDRLVAYQKEVLALLPSSSRATPDDEALRLVSQIVQKIIQGDYSAPRPLLEASASPDSVRRQLKGALNSGLLKAVHREWTSHGIQMSFRYWTRQEKTKYLKAAVGVIGHLRELSPNVCFGFGFVLGMLRSDDFIPHDDDIDVVVAWPHGPGQRLADRLEALRTHLTAKGYRVAGDHFNHIHVGRPEWPHVFDVFVGFIEGDRVSWFPSARRGLSLEWVFPPQEVVTHGVACPFPAQPEAYLAATYGSAWREPDSHFMHPWDRGQYADLA